MILEGIVTSVSSAGVVNIAPMGPHVEEGMARIELRPFQTSQTYRNLKEHGEGVLHVSDDVLLLAKAALGALDPLPALVPTKRIKGFALADACRTYEFRILSVDETGPRVRMQAEVVHQEWGREFFGFNRAKHAVVEAAILATRTDFLPPEEIEADYRKLAVIVDKTGGTQERQAFAFLQAAVTMALQRRREGAS